MYALNKKCDFRIKSPFGLLNEEEGFETITNQS